MTTTYSSTEKCAVCGTDSTHTVIGSTNAFGAQDIDTRPPEMKRSTQRFYIQNCPTCGYCAPRISMSIPQASEIIKSPAYTSLLNRADYPALSKYYLCAALIYETNAERQPAFWLTLHAAWMADDEPNKEAAINCRKLAISHFEQVYKKGSLVSEEVGFREIILADMLRRSRQFEAAETVCNEGLALQPIEFVQRVLEFTRARALAFDDACYTTADTQP